MLEYDRINISEKVDVKQMHQKNAIFATIGILKILVLNIGFKYLCNAVMI